MRVLQASTAHPLTDNRITYKHSAALAEAGHEVHVAGRPPTPPVASLTFHELTPRAGRVGRAAGGSRDLWNLIRRIRPDVVQLHDPELLPLGLALRAFSSTKVVFDLHEDLPAQILTKPHVPRMFRLPASLASRALLRVASAGLHAVVIAEPSYAPLVGRRKTWLVQNFPWLRDYPARDPKNACPKNPTDRFDVVYVGAISFARGLDVMVAAAQRACDDVVLTLAGRPEQRGSELLGSQNPQHLRYLGTLPPPSIPALLMACDAGLVVLKPTPNYIASQPTKLFEYMASGLPFIASSFTSWRSLIGEGAGLWVDPDSVDELTNSIRLLAQDPAMSAEMGRRGRAMVEERFNYEHESERLVQLHATLDSVDTPPRPAAGPDPVP